MVTGSLFAALWLFLSPTKGEKNSESKIFVGQVVHLI
jgi:hypothetical protein